ncbi:MAG: M48 family metalloprotease [bacterium]|nr:M48 family metalloprotease [bacterium]
MRALLFLFVLASAVACAVNPVTRRPEVTLISASREKEIGQEQAQIVAESMGIVRDPQLTAYVAQVGARVAARSPRRDVTYVFQIVDSDEPNAFALPGGTVYVSRGMLALLESEDELAGVLGHEIAHIAAKHAVQRVSRAAPLGVVTGLGAAVTGLVSPQLGNLVAGAGLAANEAMLAPYGRAQELEADRVGAAMAADAGYDPAALVRALAALTQDDERRGDDRRPDWFTTHPPLPRREQEAAAEATRLTRAAPDPVAATPADFLRRLDGLVIGDDPAQGVIDGSRVLHPLLGFALTFPQGWELENAPTSIGARPPRGTQAALVLAGAGQGDDPAAALEPGVRAQVGTPGGITRTTIDGLPALHVVGLTQAEDGTQVVIDITLIAFRGAIYQVAGAATRRDYAATRGDFERTAGSFRALTPAERAGIRVTRLRLVPARAGETVAQVSARAKSVWKGADAAARNGRDPGERLPAGTLVKVAVSEPYRG